MRRSSSNLVMVHWFWQSYPSWNKKKYEIFSFHSLTFIRLIMLSNDFWQLSPLKLEKIKHGFKTLAECGGIRGVDDTSSYFLHCVYNNQDLWALCFEESNFGKRKGYEDDNLYVNNGSETLFVIKKILTCTLVKLTFESCSSERLYV
jgi:hypothetical protein